MSFFRRIIGRDLDFEFPLSSTILELRDEIKKRLAEVYDKINRRRYFPLSFEGIEIKDIFNEKKLDYFYPTEKPIIVEIQKKRYSYRSLLVKW